MQIFAGFLGEGALNDSGAIDDDIFGYFGGYFFGTFGLERMPALSADKDQQESRAVAGNDTMQLKNSISTDIYSGIARGSHCDSTAVLLI